MERWERDSRALQEVIDAVRRRDIAVMVGAGVSKNAGAPLYADLARNLYGTQWRRWLDQHGEVRAERTLGKFFDRMKQADTRMHARIAEEVGKTERPGRLHQKVMTLAEMAVIPRLVTTNWDDLLMAEAKRKGNRGWARWPRCARGRQNGREAEGIIHLHGHIEIPGEMVATEAEMEELWSDADEQEFMRAILEGRILLCAGYRHADRMIATIMKETAKTGRYNAAGIYSIVERDGEDFEDRLRETGVNPIAYSKSDRTHPEVGEILDHIMREAERMRPATRRERLRTIGRRGPKAIEDWDRVRDVVTKGGADLEHLLEEANPIAWADHEAMAKGGFGLLFRERNGKEERDRRLADWLCHKLDGTKLRNILWMMHATRGGMSPVLRHRLGIELGRKEAELTPEERTMGGLVLLDEAVAWYMNDVDITMLINTGKQCTEGGRDEVAVRAFEVLTQVRAGATTRMRIDDNDQLGEEGTALGWSLGDGPMLRMLWEETVQPVVARHQERIWRASTKAMEDQQTITEATAGTADVGSSWNFRRNAIEEHGQDDLYEDSIIRVTIDGAREAIDAAGKKKTGERRRWGRYVDEAFSSRNPILVRIAVHAVGETEHWSEEQKLAWAERSKLIETMELHHETCRLLAKCWGGAEEHTKRKMAQAITTHSAGYGGEIVADEGWQERRKYDLLGWLKENGISEGSMEEVRQAIQSRNPEWIQREHADFMHYRHGARWMGAKAPEGWSGKGLVAEWMEKGEKALDRVTDTKVVGRYGDIEAWARGSPNEEGVRKVAEEATEENMAWGAALARRLASEKRWTHAAWAGVLAATGAQAGQEEAMQLLEEPWWNEGIEGGLGWHVGSMLRGAASEGSRTDWGEETRRRLQCIAAGMLGALAQQDKARENTDAVSWSINQPGGMGTEACIDLARGKGSANEVEGRERLRETLDALHQAGGTGREHVVIQTAMHLPWMAKYVNEAWVRRIVLNELEAAGSDGEGRELVWTGLAHTEWGHELTTDITREALYREVRYAEAPTRGESGDPDLKDVGASRYASCATGKIIFSGETWSEWGLEGIASERRECVVDRICRHVWHEKEIAEAGAWEGLVKPMWEELNGSGEKTSEAEQQDLLKCFRTADEANDAEGFASLFRAGPAVPPDGFFFLNKDYGGDNVQNKAAAVNVCEHCAKTYTGAASDTWTWRAVKETLAGWLEEERRQRPEGGLTDKIRDVLDTVGG